MINSNKLDNPRLKTVYGSEKFMYQISFPSAYIGDKIILPTYSKQLKTSSPLSQITKFLNIWVTIIIVYFTTRKYNKQ